MTPVLSKGLPSHGTPELALGMCFDSRSQLQELLKTLAVRDNWEFVSVKSNSTRYTVRCKDHSCPWYLHSSRPKSMGPEYDLQGLTPPFVVTVYRDQHTCLKMHKGNSVASSNWIARRIVAGILSDPKFSPNDVIAHMRLAHNVILSYKQAWRARESALQLLRSRPPCWLLSDNLGKFCKNLSSKDVRGRAVMEIRDELGRGALLPDPSECNFRRMFWAYGGALNGVLSCRRVIALGRIDHLCEDTASMLVATTRDAEDRQFPVAFAFVKQVNEGSWTWFLELFRESLIKCICATMNASISVKDICDYVRGITFVSDFRYGVHNAVAAVFPDSVTQHAVCLRFLYYFVCRQFGDAHAEIVMHAARAYTEAEFDRILDTLPTGVRESILDRWHPSLWAESMFGGRRYGIMDANMTRLFAEWDFVPTDTRAFLPTKDFIRSRSRSPSDESESGEIECPRINVPSDQFLQRLTTGLSNLFKRRHECAKRLLGDRQEISTYAAESICEAQRRVKSRHMRMDRSLMGDCNVWRVRFGNQNPAMLAIDVLDRDLMEVDKSTNEAHENVESTTEVANEYLVDLDLNHCTCMAWTKTGLPCDHAIAVLQILYNGSTKGEDWTRLVRPEFSATAYAQTYEVLIEVVGCD